MRKNGSKTISLSQYRITDLCIFALILIVAELLANFAPKWFPDSADFSLSLMLPVVTIIIMRWGWYGIIFAVVDGAFFCLLKSAVWQTYLVYIIGNAFVATQLLYAKLVGKERVRSRWYLSALMLIIGWLFVGLARSSVYAIVGESFAEVVIICFGIGDSGALTLVLGILLIVALRRFDGMFEDQKHYLIRLDEERRAKMRPDSFGDEPIEVDEESLSILRRWDDGLDK